jgi:hypothetical protein
MDWQEMTSLLVVGSTAGWMFWKKWGPRKLRFDPIGACHCGLARTAARRPSVVYHARRGERPQVVVRLK